MKPYGSKPQDRGGDGCRCCPDKAGRWCKRRERQQARRSATADAGAPIDRDGRLTYASAGWMELDGDPCGDEYLDVRTSSAAPQTRKR